MTEAEIYLGTPHIFIDGNVIDDFAEIPRLAAEHHVKITDVHPETVSFRYHLCSLDEEWNKSSVSMYKNAILYASQIGAESVNTNLTGAFRDINQSEIFESLVRNLQELAMFAEQNHVLLSLETESPRFEGFITRLKQMKELDARVDSPALRFGINITALLDAKESIEEWQEEFGDGIRYMRFSSIEEFQSMQGSLRGYVGKPDRKIFFFNDDCYLDKPMDVDKALKEAIYGTD